MMIQIWSEFKTTVFPWVIAAAVALAIHYTDALHIQTLKDENTGLREVNTHLSEQVGRMNEFLATQGYVASPFRPSPAPTVVAK